MRFLALTLVLFVTILAGCSEDQNPLTNLPDGGNQSTTLQKQARPFYGTSTGMSSSVLSSTCGYPYNLEQTATGTGDFSHLGFTSVSAHYCSVWTAVPGTTPLPWGGPVIGTGILVAANGDKVFLSSSGTYTVPAAMPLMLYSTGTYTITGGTGRFEEASGSGTVTAVQELGQLGTPHVTTLTVSGTISY